MIIKFYELKKKNLKENKFFLFYGNNEGLIKDIIKNDIRPLKKDIIFRYDEDEVLKDLDLFLENLSNQSFFDNEKLIIISRATNKIFNSIREIIEKNTDDTRIILISKSLDKKSKLRNFFEKNKETVCIPIYEDTPNTLNYITQNFLKEKKISLSQEIINLIIERSRGDRTNLYNELEKITSYSKNNNMIKKEDIFKLTNLSENYDISELVDNTLAKNKKKTLYILNENNFINEDSLIILRIFLNKLKRLLKIKSQINGKYTVDHIITNFKPPIFWKDKEILKKQIEVRNSQSIKSLIIKLNNLELLIKKYPSNSTNLITNFVLEQTI